MTPEVKQELEQILYHSKEPFKRVLHVKELLDRTPTVEPQNPLESNIEPSRGTRTLSQNKALHLGMQFIADELNNAGYDMKKVLKESVDIPWTKDTVKEYLVKPIMKALYHHESTTELKKTEEIEKVWDTLMRHLGEKFHIEYVPFPSNEEQSWENLKGIKLEAYNTYH